MASREREFELDLESGGTTSEDDRKVASVSGSRQPRKLLSKVVSGVLNFDGRIDDESGVNSSGSSSNLSGLAEEHVELLIDKSSGGEEGPELLALMKKHMKDKHKRTNPSKLAKPPRPPRGPTLDAADQKLVREISEFAMKKRARIERMKALKKMKAAKSSSSNSSASAMIITVLFFLIILFQGIRSRSNLTVTFHGSPESAATTRGGFIKVHYFSTPAANESHGPGSVSPSLVKQVAGSDSGDKRE